MVNIMKLKLNHKSWFFSITRELD